MKGKKLTTILLIATLMISTLTVAVSVQGLPVYHGMAGGTIQVTSITPVTELDESAFDAEPETLVLDDVVFDAQSGPVIIDGKISALTGTVWPDTAYIEIGVRPKATKDERNSGVYMIFYSLDADNYYVHLQDYTGHGHSLGFSVAKNLAPFTYKITLTPTGDIGGTAELELKDKNGAVVGTNIDVPYGYSSTWEEGVEGPLDEDFSEAYLFYSIVADRRGVAGETYSATVGAITTNKVCPVADAGGPYSGSVRVPIIFDGSGSSDDGTIESYAWDFGDGATGTGIKPSHKYSSKGTYTVKLTVTDDDLLTDIDTTTVSVVAASGFSADNIDITNDNDEALGDAGEKGHTIILEGDSGSVASGYEVLVYWDKIQDWDGKKGFLNKTDAESDGGFTVWFKVPEAPVGDHYLWFEATDQEGKVSKTFEVLSDCDISTASGLEGSKIYVDLWGFAKNKEVAILFVEKGDGNYPASFDTFDFTPVPDENLEEGVELDEDDYDGTLVNEMIVPGTFVLKIIKEGVEYTFEDHDSDGKLYSEYGENCGSINYVTGEWSIDLGDTDATEEGKFYANYVYFIDNTARFYVITSTGVTDELGSWEDRRITIPDDALPAGKADKQYYVVGMDGKNNGAYDDFRIGATITLSTDEGDVGDKVEVSGEGFPAKDSTHTYELKCEIWRNDAKVEDVHIIDSKGEGTGDDVTDGDGEFEFDIIIPQVEKKDDDYEIRVFTTKDGETVEAFADFEVTGLAEVSTEPSFGPQGSSITVYGENFQNIKDSKVEITLVKDGVKKADIKDNVKLDSDGSFEVRVTVPTENDGTYKIKVEDIADEDDGAFYIEDTVDFRIGTIMVLLSKDESVVGDMIVLTGNGFEENGEWNATFGDIAIFSEEQADGAGLLRANDVTPQFFVPQVQPGEYIITVWDVDAEITVETEFTVTEYTVLDFELYEAPNEFNVTIEGWNWPEVVDGLNEADVIEFVIWNETDDWEMDVIQYGDHVDDPLKNPEDRDQKAAALNSTGFLNDAWWVVPVKDTLSKGTYWINATIETETDQEYFMQLEFVIGDVHVYAAPRKAIFRIGDTVSFKIQHTFGNDAAQKIKDGDIKVYDPDGDLYWDTDPLTKWSKVETWYESTTSSQVANSNPMILLDDAPLGTWTYKWRDDEGETIKEGTFNVEASEAEIIGKQIDDLNQAISELTDDITGVTEAITGVQSNVQSAIQAANAAVEAANAAVDAVNAVAGVAGDAAEAADRAAEAAGKAQDAAGGLTTLVYGAIGASLVAALAAIVSLMQISKRIAG